MSLEQAFILGLTKHFAQVRRRTTKSLHSNDSVISSECKSRMRTVGDDAIDLTQFRVF